MLDELEQMTVPVSGRKIFEIIYRFPEGAYILYPL
jgi:hypothetical protein